MSDFIKQQQRSLTERLKELDAQLQGWDALREEKARIEAALKALGPAGNGSTTSPARRTRGKATTAPTASSKAGPRKTKATAASRSKGRGARRSAATRASGIGAKIVAHVSERPGVTVDALVEALGEQRRVVYRNAYSLATRGKLERVQLPGGQTGFRLPAAASAD